MSHISRTTLALALAAALAGCAYPPPQVPAGATVAQAAPPPPRTVSVTGSGEIKTAPDEFVLSVGVDTFEAEAAAAKQANDRTMHALIAATQAAGVDPKDVRTENFNLGPRLEGPYDKRKLVGYEVRKNLVVIVRNGDKMEALLAELFKLGANRLDGISFGSSKIAEQRKEARALAMTAARDKAAAMAASLGQKLGRPLKIEEDPAEQGAYRPFGNPYANAFVNNDTHAAVGEALAPGKVRIQATVAVTFELTD
jgi:uncharacterized protein YggE